MSTSKSGKDQASAADKLRAWVTGRLPASWTEGPPDITIDREEVTIIVPVAAPQAAGDATDAERSAAAAGRSRRFREETRDQRIEIASEAEYAFGRKVSWGVVCDGMTMMFTTLSVPVMTRLRQPERIVLDTLVDAGVARSRSDALAWCARLVGDHEEAWLGELRAALHAVEQAREAGPRS